MKRLVLLLFLVLASHGQAVQLPQPAGHVNDFAGILPMETVQMLEANLVKLEHTDSIPFILSTVRVPRGETLGSWAATIAEGWRKGMLGMANGIMVFVSGDFNEVHIELGSVLARKLDADFRDVLATKKMLPLLQAKDMEGAVNVAISAFRHALKDEKRSGAGESGTVKNLPSPLLVLLMPVMILSVLLATASPLIPAVGCGLGLPALLFYSGLAGEYTLLIPAGALGAYYGHLLGTYVREASTQRKGDEVPGGDGARSPFDPMVARETAVAGISLTIGGSEGVRYSSMREGRKFPGVLVSSDW